MSDSVVMALDAGTTSIRAILFNHDGDVVVEAAQEFPQIYPRPGWVEHNPLDIWNTQVTVAKEALARAGITARDVAAIGVTNQRETTIVWDRVTGAPVTNAIVWQDRRTAAFCDRLKANGLEEHVRATTGLLIDAYFSGTKLAWILDNIPGVRGRAERGELAFGTVDSWLIWNLTGGTVHVTDYTNASRTMLFDIHRLAWDDRMLKELNIPPDMLPEVRQSSEVYGHTCRDIFIEAEIPIASAIGDQHAALFGQACFEPGMVKTTYGTGASLVMNTGDVPVRSTAGLLTIPAWGLDGTVEYALEGLIFVSGATVQWLRDELKIVYDAADTEFAARRVPDSNGVYFVPAFVGLAAPHWDPYARGAIVGLTLGANRNHIIRAALEAICYQICDVITLMENDSGIEAREIRADGGAARNSFLMQLQADLLDIGVVRPTVVETTARGAAYLAGLATGYWKDRAELTTTYHVDRTFVPQMPTATRSTMYAGWQKAVSRARSWEDH
ncbi:glycerol kinase GlpK [Mycolicibacterium komossense]|uniref:Glycerol kinase n=1 Tax=Mycolicibacterium komossense TaxID=1779 RepID=A0ABT3CB71_9MYCO|nr:glycerol kinase GlpK [Mycolicibacterium komossense]MCV7226725.1 glycerol kinase GlpK [Mycolicibacterium komossense]